MSVASHIVTKITFDHTVTTITFDNIVTIALYHTVATMILDNTAAVYTIVEFVMPLVVLLTSSPLEFSVLQKVYPTNLIRTGASYREH
jgi:hypothetical protein